MSTIAVKRLKWALLIIVPILLVAAMFPGIRARREQAATQSLLMECRDPNRDRAGIAVLQKFIDKGADVNGRCLGDCPPDLADNAPTPLQLVLMSGAQMHSRDGVDFKERDDVPVLELFLKHGADNNARDKTGTTALMIAAVSRSPKYTKFLLDKGAGVNLRSDSMKFPNSPAKISPTALDQITYRLSPFFQKSWPHAYKKDDLIRIKQMLIDAGAKN